MPVMTPTMTNPAAVPSGPELQDLRKRAGLSRQRLAELCSCSYGAIAAFELGARPAVSPTLERAVKVLQTLVPETEGGAHHLGPGR